MTIISLPVSRPAPYSQQDYAPTNRFFQRLPRFRPSPSRVAQVLPLREKEPVPVKQTRQSPAVRNVILYPNPNRISTPTSLYGRHVTGCLNNIMRISKEKTGEIGKDSKVLSWEKPGVCDESDDTIS